MDTSSWKWFRYDEIFDIKHGFYNKKPEDNPEGDIPFIGATDSNNGVTSHSDLETIAITTKTGDGSNSPLSEKIFENCIAVTNNGSVGFAYYQAKTFTCTHDVNPLYLKGHELNPYIALFLCTIIEKERFRWAYGRKWRPIRMPSSKIKLPAIKNANGEDEPDWQFMENFIKDTIIPQLPKKAQRVWLKKYDPTPKRNMKMQLNTKVWEWFLLDNLFTINRGKTLTSDDKEYYQGDIPCVNGTSTNNGVLCYLSEDIETKGFNKQPVPSLSLCRVGTSGLTFVQTKPYYIADNAFCLQLKSSQNLYVYLFISALLDRECVKYCYGRTISSEKYMQTRIKLPAIKNENGEYEPDWQFMEDYIKSLPYSKNLEPSKPDEIVDEMMEVKKEMIKLRHQLQAQQSAQPIQIIGGNVTYNDYSTNYNVKK